MSEADGRTPYVTGRLRGRGPGRGLGAPGSEAAGRPRELPRAPLRLRRRDGRPVGGGPAEALDHGPGAGRARDLYRVSAAAGRPREPLAGHGRQRGRCRYRLADPGRVVPPAAGHGD